jgi:hypothetical protein
MNRLSFILFAVLIIAIGGGAVWYLVDTRNDAFGTREDTLATTTPEISEGLAIYTNGPHGFSIFYPESSEVAYAFEPSYHVGSAWRMNALPESEGAPVVAIIPYAVRSEDSYPRYFTAMVRIGASSDPKEVARCESIGQGEAALPDASINGRTWKAFSFAQAGMMQYARGVSYRTLFEGKCIAMEKIQAGSSYREDAPTERDVPDTVLLSEYEKLSAIVESFTFAR